VLSLVSRAFLPPSPHEHDPHNLTPASGRQDHTTSPSASLLFVNSSFTSIAFRFYVRDDREAPLMWKRNARIKRLIWPFNKAEYFFGDDWTGKSPWRRYENLNGCINEALAFTRSILKSKS
jgi:hypothetical protein